MTCRGNERRAIFKGDDDRHNFLRILSQSIGSYSVLLHAYVLMDNHFHLLVTTPLGNLAEFMRHFNITYTSYFNRRHTRAGHLYQGRYKSILVDRESYLSVLSRYIHLNPIRVLLVEQYPDEQRIDFLLQYPWSSLPGYLDKKRRSEIVDCALVLESFGGDTIKGRTAYLNQLLTDMQAGLTINSEIVGQSLIGGDSFMGWVKDTFLAGKKTAEHPRAEKIRFFRRKETILALIEEATGKDLEALKLGRGRLRQLAMDLLYRYGGLRGPEIGALFGVSYSAVSQERRRLREEKGSDPSFVKLKRDLERKMSTLKV